MGEYAVTPDQGTVKIGTCNSMYYLRFDDRDKARPVGGDINAATTDNLLWRLPFPDEDHIGTAKHGTADAPVAYDRGLMLVRTLDDGYPDFYTDPDLANDPGRIQLTHPSGLLVNADCYHGLRLPEAGGGFTCGWNGKTYSLELMHVKNDPSGKIYPVIGCRHCRNIWTVIDDPSDPQGTAWAGILDYVEDPEMHRRLSVYARTVAQ